MILSDSEKTGKLNVTTGTQEGMIVFRGGKIIYAASSTIRETFGSIALTLQIVSSRQLEQAVQLQYRSHEDKRLGEILVELGATLTGATYTFPHVSAIQHRDHRRTG